MTTIENFNKVGWMKRVHSLSLLEVSEGLAFDECILTWEQQQQKALLQARLRTRSNNYVEKSNRCAAAEEFLRLRRQGQELLKMRPERFPFPSIPDNCKLLVFSHLSVYDRASAAQVCTEWRSLMKSYKLWSSIDLTTFPMLSQPSDDDETPELDMESYERYRTQIQQFISYLTLIGAPLKSFRFAYDIGDHRDGWLDLIQSFLRSVPCHELESADLNWKETPSRPPLVDNLSITWSTSDYNDLTYHQRHRQRIFVKFFDFFTSIATCVSCLRLPFDWSERTLHALGRLVKLEELVLEKYFLFQGLEQRQLDELFQFAPNLRRLVIEVWTPSGRGLQFFQLRSSSLRHLDVAGCRGFYLTEVDAPNLEVYKASRHSCYGPIVSADQCADVPCIFRVIRDGTPRLQHLNGLHLKQKWREGGYPELDVILQSTCSCALHVPAK